MRPEIQDTVAALPRAYVYAILCCSRTASAALSSAMASGFLSDEDTGACVYNPASPALAHGVAAGLLPHGGTPPLAWHWNETGCWVEDWGDRCNATSAGAASAARGAEAYAMQSIIADFLPTIEYNESAIAQLLAIRQVRHRVTRSGGLFAASASAL